MLRKIGELLGKGYLLLLTVAAGGFVGANIAGFVPAIWEFTSNPTRVPDPAFVQSWIHGGWVIGAGLFALGAVARVVRKHAFTKKGPERPRLSSKKHRSKPEGFSVTIGSRRCGILGSVGVGGLIGGFLGLMLGGSFLLLWFSVAHSPFAPDDWASSISIETIGPETARPRNRAATTDHPVALYAFGGPIVLGIVAGAVISGVGTAAQRWKSRDGNME